jgi:hypothetical protein
MGIESNERRAGMKAPSWLRSVWRTSGPMRGAVTAGAIAGLISAGVGSRVTMRIIALADPDTDGVRTDAEATVGEFTLSGTIDLLMLGAIAGVMGGAVYLGMRRWLPVPNAWKGPAYGIFTLLTVGQLLFDTNHADFQIFEPVVLVIALFAVLFLVNGLILGPLMQRIHPEPSYRHSARVSRAAAGLVAIVCVVGAVGYADTIPTMLDDESTCLSARGGGNGCAVRPDGVAP